MHDDDRMIGRLLTRRELVALFGSSAVAAMANRVSGQAATRNPAPSGTAVPACVVQPQQTEGPYFVDEKSRRSDIRSDLSTGASRRGRRSALTMKVSQVTPDGKCAPLPGAQVDLWQCDAMGVYSDVKDKLFDTTGQKFLRGHQITDARRRREVRDHLPRLVSRAGGARALQGSNRCDRGYQAYEFTSQFYFDEPFTDRVHAREPYVAHTGQRTRNESDGIFKKGGTQLMLPVTEAGGPLAAAFDLAMRPGDPPPAGRGGRGGRRGGR